MKKNLLLSVLGMLMCVGLFGQEIDFKYKVDSVNIEGNLTYNITISITKGTGPFIYELCDKNFAEGGKVIQKSDAVSDLQFTFINLPKESYYIYVYLSNEKSAKGKRINL